MKKKNIRLLVFSLIGYSVIFLLILSAVFVLVSHAKGDDPFIGPYSLMWVKTGSMSPLIPEKSYILVEKAEAESVRLNDVIVFISDDPAIAGQKNVHRVVGVACDKQGNPLFTTRGDNTKTNMKEDEYPARSEKLIGKYVKTLPLLSIMGRMLSTTVGLFVVIVLIVGVLMAIYLPEIARVIRQAETIKTEKQATMEELIQQEVARLKAEAEREKRQADAEKTGGDAALERENGEEEQGI